MNRVHTKPPVKILIISTLLALLLGKSSALQCAWEHEIAHGKQELESPRAELPLQTHVNKTHVEQAGTPATPANSQKIRAALKDAIRNKNRQEGNEQLEMLLEHDITKLPGKEREPLLDKLLKLAFFAQQEPQETYAMELLLGAKADPNALTAGSQASEASSSALHWATMCSKPQAVQLFLDHGADPLVINDVGISALETGTDKEINLLFVNHTIQRLKAKRSDPNYLNPNYKTPNTQNPLLSMVLNVHVSFLPQIVPLVQELLERGANPNEPNKKGDLPLHTIRGFRLIAPSLARTYAPEEKDQEELYAALHNLDKMLCKHGALEYALQAPQWPCVIQ
jgi:hypothetical protein